MARHGRLYTTRCGHCGARDTFWRMAACANLKIPGASMDPTPLVQFLKQLALMARGLNPGRPILEDPMVSEAYENFLTNTDESDTAECMQEM